MVESVVGQICMFKSIEIVTLRETFESGRGKCAQELEKLDKERTTTVLGLSSETSDLVSRDRANLGIGINKDDHTVVSLNMGLQDQKEIIPPQFHLVESVSTIRRMNRKKVNFAKWILDANEKESRIFSTENNVFVIVKIRARNAVFEIANRTGLVKPNRATQILTFGGGRVHKKIGTVLDPCLDARFLKTCNIDGK